MPYFILLLIQTAAGAGATVSFCLLFSVPLRQWLYCGIVGGIAWLFYYTLAAQFNEVFATLCATMAIVLLSRILSLLRKCPVTLLLLPGIIPLAPGMALYYTAYYFVADDLESAGQSLFLAVKLAAAIVIGIIVIFAIPMKPPHKKNSSQDTKG